MIRTTVIAVICAFLSPSSFASDGSKKRPRLWDPDSSKTLALPIEGEEFYIDGKRKKRHQLKHRSEQNSQTEFDDSIDVKRPLIKKRATVTAYSRERLKTMETLRTYEVKKSAAGTLAEANKTLTDPATCHTWPVDPGEDDYIIPDPKKIHGIYPWNRSYINPESVSPNDVKKKALKGFFYWDQIRGFQIAEVDGSRQLFVLVQWKGYPGYRDWSREPAHEIFTKEQFDDFLVMINMEELTANNNKEFSYPD